MTKILGIIGSMRRDQHTDALVRYVIGEMTNLDSSVEATAVYTADGSYSPCRVACHNHCAHQPFSCSIADGVPDLLAQMSEADAIILGAPLYFRAPPSGFHTMVERIQSMAFFHETVGGGKTASPLAGLPCGLVAVAEYSNPHVILEYLHDFATLMRMRPIQLDAFPYLGVGAHGDPASDEICRPFDRAVELARRLVDAAHIDLRK